MSLTYEKLMDSLKDLPAPPPTPPWSCFPSPYSMGMPVYPQRNWPSTPVLIGYRIFPAHPWVRWLYRHLRKIGIKASPWVRLSMMEPRESDPIMLHGSLFLSYYQYSILQVECTA